jgi:hypothetical protein
MRFNKTFNFGWNSCSPVGEFGWKHSFKSNYYSSTKCDNERFTWSTVSVEIRWLITGASTITSHTVLSSVTNKWAARNQSKHISSLMSEKFPSVYVRIQPTAKNDKNVTRIWYFYRLRLCIYIYTFFCSVMPFFRMRNFIDRFYFLGRSNKKNYVYLYLASTKVSIYLHENDRKKLYARENKLNNKTWQIFIRQCLHTHIQYKPYRDERYKFLFASNKLRRPALWGWIE